MYCFLQFNWFSFIEVEKEKLFSVNEALIKSQAIFDCYSQPLSFLFFLVFQFVQLFNLLVFQSGKLSFLQMTTFEFLVAVQSGLMSSTQDVGSSNFVSLTIVDYWRHVIVESGDTHNFIHISGCHGALYSISPQYNFPTVQCRKTLHKRSKDTNSFIINLN